MTCQNNNNAFLQISEILFNEGMDGLSTAITILVNEAMLIERTRHLNANPYERNVDRHGYANGFKDKNLKTRVGALELKVPQVRESNFYPSFLEKGLRSERALTLSIAEMYVNGVSTRKVQNIMEQLCGFDVTSSEVSRAAKLLDEELENWRKRPLGKYRYLFLDARYEKVRYEGRVIDLAILIATGISENGKREVLGVSVKLSEQEVHWRDFLQSLQTRGLHGIELIISDAHSGLKAAKRAIFPSIPWQRCQFHLQQNAQNHIPKKSLKEQVAHDIRSIFNASDKVEAERILKLMTQKYQKDAPSLSEWMLDNLPEGFTVFTFPLNHQKKLRTSNIAERLNREIKRRTRTVGIFPNVASCERLISAILVETCDKWQIEDRYLDVS
jgi:putative transposase